MSLFTSTKEPVNKTASNVFLSVVFVSAVFSLLVYGISMLGVDFNNFWVNLCAIAFKYLMYFGVFVLFVRLSGLRHGKWKRELFMEKAPRPLPAFITFVMAAVCIAGFILLSAAVIQLFERMGFTSPGAFVIDGWWQYVACIIVVAALPAVIEELIFRGLILRGLKDYGTVTSVIASALLFTLFHMNPAQTVFQFVLGIVLAVVVLVSGNTFYAMLLHFANNFIVLTYTFITGDPELLVTFNFAWVMALVFSAVLATALLYGLTKALKKDFVFKKSRKTFFSIDNSGYFFAVALALMIWIFAFIGV